MYIIASSEAVLTVTVRKEGSQANVSSLLPGARQMNTAPATLPVSSSRKRHLEVPQAKTSKKPNNQPHEVLEWDEWGSTSDVDRTGEMECWVAPTHTTWDVSFFLHIDKSHMIQLHAIAHDTLVQERLYNLSEITKDILKPDKTTLTQYYFPRIANNQHSYCVMRPVTPKYSYSLAIRVGKNGMVVAAGHQIRLRGEWHVYNFLCAGIINRPNNNVSVLTWQGTSS